MRLREKQAEERAQRDNPWSGLWFVNVGMDDVNAEPCDSNGNGNVRHWSNCVQYGYIAAGGGSRYSAALKKLDVGAEIMAYQKGMGYVGYGGVTSVAQPIQLFRVDESMLTDVLGQLDYNDNNQKRTGSMRPVSSGRSIFHWRSRRHSEASSRIRMSCVTSATQRRCDL